MNETDYVVWDRAYPLAKHKDLDVLVDPIVVFTPPRRTPGWLTAHQLGPLWPTLGRRMA